MLCYDRESFPTRDEAIDWVWASTSEEIEAVEFVLRRFLISKMMANMSNIASVRSWIYTGGRLRQTNESLPKGKRNVKKVERSVHESCTKRHLTINQ